MAEIRHHIADEEGETFAHMRQVIDAEELRKLGGRVEAFKKVAPTRPHPNVPNEPGPRMAAGPAASLIDRLRDLATGRGTGDSLRDGRRTHRTALVAADADQPDGSLPHGAPARGGFTSSGAPLRSWGRWSAVRRLPRARSPPRRRRSPPGAAWPGPPGAPTVRIAWR
jgi:hypothetical protein